MKFFILKALLCYTLFIPLVSSAQDTLFVDEEWKETKKHLASYWGNCDSSSCKFYYFTGEPAGDFEMYNQKRHGVSSFYYKNGQLSEKALFFHGRPIDTIPSWYSNGQLKQELVYVPNYFKMINFYDSTGKQTVINGNGDVILYFENKKVHSKGSYVEGKKHGYWIFYSDSGAYKSGNYEHNKMVGEWKEGDKDGNLLYSYFLTGKKYVEGIKYNEQGTQTQFFQKYDPRLGKEVKYLYSNFAMQLNIGAAKWLYDQNTKKYLGNHAGPSFRIALYYKKIFLSLGFRPATISPADTLFVSPQKLYNTAQLNVVKTDFSLGYSVTFPWGISLDPYAGYIISSFPVINEEELGSTYNLSNSKGFTLGVAINKNIKIGPEQFLLIYLNQSYSFSNYRQVYNLLGKNFYSIEVGLGLKGRIYRKMK